MTRACGQVPSMIGQPPAGTGGRRSTALSRDSAQRLKPGDGVVGVVDALLDPGTHRQQGEPSPRWCG